MTIEIEGMHCEACVGAIRVALAGLQGVKCRGVQVGTAEVTIDETRASRADLFRAIRGAGAFEIRGFRVAN